MTRDPGSSPVLRRSHVAPASSVCQTPAAEIATEGSSWATLRKAQEKGTREIPRWRALIKELGMTGSLQ